MYWWDKCRWGSKYSFTGLYLVLVGTMVGGCIDASTSEGFETSLISLNQVLDSCFTHGLDSVQTVTKTLIFSNEDPETRTLTKYNIHNDLDIIRKYDVATPRWADFVETTQRDSAGLMVIDYAMTNNRAPVQSMRFIKKGDQITDVKIHSRKKSVISSQDLRVEWTLNEGYTLTNESKLIFRKPTKFTMKVNY